MSIGDFLAAGVAALNAGDVSQAYRMLLAVTRDGGAQDHEFGSAWYNLGLLLSGLLRWESAAAAYGRANAVLPGRGMIMGAYGWHLHCAGRTVEAEYWLRRAVEGEPLNGVHYVHLSHVLATLGRDEESLGYALRGYDLSPENREVGLGLAFGLFFAGRWAEGWRAFEARIGLKMPEVFQYPWPVWDGREVKRLFLRCEQGLGDTLMMMRYFTDVDLLVSERVICLVQGPLVGLVREMYPGWDVGELEHSALPVEADAYVLSMGLPLLVRGVGGVPYIAGGGRRVGPVRRVGLAWCGDAKHMNDGHRSVPLKELVCLTEVAGVEFVSLQVGERGKGDIEACFCGSLIEDLSGEIGDMRDTVRIMGGLDLVICVDTAVGHLAGAMGVPCWLLINARGTDWRWGRSGETTQWYAGHRLFRRGLDEDWSAVVRRLKVELSRLARGELEEAA